MDIFQRFRFEAARRLPALPPEHPCARMHGHSFLVEVRLCGALDPDLGWVQDFAAIQQAWTPLREALDHRCLNEVKGLENPTSERLAIWIWDRLKPALPALIAVTVMETPDSGCEYRG